MRSCIATCRALVLLAMVIGSAAVVMACGDSSTAGEGKADEGADRIEEIRPTAWQVASRPSDREVTLIVQATHCAGAPKPRIERVTTKRDPHRLVLTAFLSTFRSGGKNEICIGLEIGLKRRVTLPTGSAGLPLYDGSASPPKQRSARG